MVDDPTTEDALPTPEQEDTAILQLRETIDRWLLELQLEGTEPFVAASKLFDVLVEVLKPAMGMGAIRTALLVVYDKTYERPTNFDQRLKAKQLLDNIANARRKVEGAPFLITPGDDDGAA